MKTERIRRTIKSSVSFEGVGLHSGVPTRCTVYAGQDGLALRYGQERVLALAENAVDTPLQCTQIGSVRTVEHLLSALAALGITDAEIELTAPEPPGLDGSAIGFFTPLKSAGVEELASEEISLPFKRVFVQDGDVKVAIGAGPGEWWYEYNTGDRWPNKMEIGVQLNDMDYEKDIAPARTFVMAELIEAAEKAGMGQGLDNTSCLILGLEGYENEPRFPDEPVRHKILDLMGDFVLTGLPLEKLNVTAQRSGHRHHIAAALKVRQFLGLVPA